MSRNSPSHVGLLCVRSRGFRETAEMVLAHGFEKGSKRVGRVGKLDREEKVERAVVAHARHNCTDYDALLRTFRRARVEKARKKAREDISGRLNACLRDWRSPDYLSASQGNRITGTKPTGIAIADQVLGLGTKV